VVSGSGCPWVTPVCCLPVAVRALLEAARIGAACRALRTRGQRHRILADLAVQPGCWWAIDHPDVRAMAGALLTPLIGGGLSLEEACDRRALEREAAANPGRQGRARRSGV
jgi:hypothetical protein